MVPLLIQRGEADGWVPAAPRVTLAETMRRGGYTVQMTTYPEAHRGFDSPNSRVRLLPDVWNPSAAGQRGAHVGANEP